MISRSIRFAFLFLFFIGLPIGFAAEDRKTPVSVKAELSNAFITIGDPVDYTISVRHDPDIKLLNTPPLPADEIFKINSIKEFKEDVDGQVVEGKTMNLTTFRLGEFVMEPVEIRFQHSDGTEGVLRTERIYLTVKSVAGGEPQTDIRPAKNVLEMAKETRWALISILSMIGLGIIVFFIYFFRRHKQISPAEPEIVLSPEEEAIQNLNRLFDSDLLRQGKIKEYYSRLSEILRVFFERRFSILAVESTTYEIVRFLKVKEIDRILIEKIDEVLQAADLAKFAKWKPEPQDIVVLNKKAKQIVEDAKPKEPIDAI